MATILQVPVTSSFLSCCCSSSSSNPSLKRRSFIRPIYCSITNSSSKLPIPPINPKDPFLSKLASVAASSPEILLNRPSNSDTPPYLDIFDSPSLIATPATVERSVSYNEHRPRRPPPDLPSLLLHGRIVCIGMPWMDPKEPIFLYINSTGTTRDDGETVGMEIEGFAIYDAMMQLKNEVSFCIVMTYTYLAVGAAIGQACLLLAAGTKGKRFMMPHAKAMIQQPRAPSSGLMPASDVFIRAKESTEVVADVMKRPFYMDSTRAKEFGVIDKILWRGQEQIMSDVAAPEDWNKNAGIKVHTVAVEAAIGQACLLLAAGTKGKAMIRLVRHRLG
ncbi:hypothetical protein ACH5RR_001537 [Cinchona calisaya]|uniref:ATP-dependent Clp protease proteolytic subunit n=1 Tax=Cinchona calisaya TaxID=153742 RepID=A0ABD3B3Y9_9GENT